MSVSLYVVLTRRNAPSDYLCKRFNHCFMPPLEIMELKCLFDQMMLSFVVRLQRRPQWEVGCCFFWCCFRFRVFRLALQDAYSHRQPQERKHKGCCIGFKDLLWLLLLLLSRLCTLCYRSDFFQDVALAFVSVQDDFQVLQHCFVLNYLVQPPISPIPKLYSPKPANSVHFILASPPLPHTHPTVP